LKTCTATLEMLNQPCTRTAKTHAIPSLHRDSFLAKVPGPCPDTASGNTISPYCRAVMWHSKSQKTRFQYFRQFLLDKLIRSVYQDSAIYNIYLDMTGLPQRSLQIVIHGFVFLNLQNRLMSTICKICLPSQTLFGSIYLDLKDATPHNGLF
jgi:hypothetical protein